MAGYIVSGLKVIYDDNKYRLIVYNKARNDGEGMSWDRFKEGETKEELFDTIKKSIGLFTGSCKYNKSALTKKMNEIVEKNKHKHDYIYQLYNTEEFKMAFLKMIEDKIKRCDYNFNQKYYK